MSWLVWLWRTLKSLKPGRYLPTASGGPRVRADPRLHHGDGVRTQLWLRQDGELQDVSGDGGGGRSSLQAAPPGLRQQVRCVCLAVAFGPAAAGRKEGKLGSAGSSSE